MSTAEKITDSALRLFYRNGYHASGVELLSQEAGVTKRTLYRHFPSKEHLVEAALQLRDRELMAQMFGAIEGVPVKKRPLAYIDFIAAWAAQADFSGCAFINASAEYGHHTDRPHVLAKAHKQRVLACLEQVCVEAGWKNPARLAHQIFLIGEGLIVACQIHQVQDEFIEAARTTIAMLTTA